MVAGFSIKDLNAEADGMTIQDIVKEKPAFVSGHDLRYATAQSLLQHVIKKYANVFKSFKELKQALADFGVSGQAKPTGTKR